MDKLALNGLFSLKLTEGNKVVAEVKEKNQILETFSDLIIKQITTGQTFSVPRIALSQSFIDGSADNKVLAIDLSEDEKNDPKDIVTNANHNFKLFRFSDKYSDNDIEGEVVFKWKIEGRELLARFGAKSQELNAFFLVAKEQELGTYTDDNEWISDTDSAIVPITSKFLVSPVQLNASHCLEGEWKITITRNTLSV